MKITKATIKSFIKVHRANLYVKVDSTNNSQASIDNGDLTIEVGVSLQRPAEFVIIKIGQFNGRTTVTTA